jgi:heptosyltransferase III
MSLRKVNRVEPYDADAKRSDHATDSEPAAKVTLKSQRGSRLRRFIDQWVGCPLLLALGLCRRKREVPARVQTIGFLSLSAIGDTIIASAIANDLKIAFPHAKIIAFVSPLSKGITEIISGFDQEVVIPTTRPLRALQIIRKCPTDVTIDICAWPRITALYAALARTRFTMGFRTKGALRHWAFDRAIEHSAELHEIDNFRALLEPFRIYGASLPRAAADLLPQGAHSAEDSRAPAIVFHPWASGFRSHLKEWPEKNWVSLAQELVERGYRLIITGSPFDAERSSNLCLAIDRPGHVTSLAGRSDLADTAKCIAHAAAVVCVNTGVMHLAAAFDRPLVALHGPTNPLRWGPLSKRAVVVAPPATSGCGYLNLGFEYPANPPDCMSAIKVSDVLIRLQDAIGS